MTVYYFTAEVSPHNRAYCKGQVAKFMGIVQFGTCIQFGETVNAICMTEIDHDLRVEKNVVRARGFVLDEDVYPPRVVRNDFGWWVVRIESVRAPTTTEELDGTDSFWRFFRLDHSLPEYVTTEKGDILRVSDGEIIMPGPELLKKP